MSETRSTAGRRRRAATLMEVTISMILIAAALAAVGQAAWLVAAQRRSLSHRRMAQAEAVNAHERLSRVGWPDLTAERAGAEKLSAAARSTLPGGTLQVVVEDAQGEPAGKRVIVEVRWRDASGETAPHVRLVRWRYRTKRDK